MIPIKLAHASYLMFSSWAPAKLKISWVVLSHLCMTTLVVAILPWSTTQIQLFEFLAWASLIVANGHRFRSSPTPKRHLALMLAILASPTTVSKVSGEQVYDCSTAKTTVATYSIGEVGECPDFEHMYRNKTLIRAQILQRSGGQLLKGYQCQLTSRREACRCGAFSQRKIEIKYSVKKELTFIVGFTARLSTPKTKAELTLCLQNFTRGSTYFENELPFRGIRP